MTTAVVAIGTTIATLLALHTIINGILLRRPAEASDIEEHVAILIPCRNEVDQVNGLVKSLTQQSRLKQVEIIFLDDQSTDGTRAALQQATAGHPQMHVITGADLPSGWLGKPFACHQLAEATSTADVLVFIDADVRLAPTGVAQAVATLRDLDLELVSPYPRQESRTWSERLAQPLLQWSWLATLPLRIAERSRRRSLSAANGQFLVVDAHAYRQSGGHAAIRDQVLDDMRLLQSLKSHGYRGVVVDGSELARCRMYTGWPQLRAGYTKWLWSAFGTRIASSAIGVALFLAFIVPFVAALSGSIIGWVGYFVAVVSRMIAAVRSGDRLIDAIWHPFSILLLLILIAMSWRGRARGSLTWKERQVS